MLYPRVFLPCFALGCVLVLLHLTRGRLELVIQVGRESGFIDFIKNGRQTHEDITSVISWFQCSPGILACFAVSWFALTRANIGLVIHEEIYNGGIRVHFNRPRCKNERQSHGDIAFVLFLGFKIPRVFLHCLLCLALLWREDVVLVIQVQEIVVSFRQQAV